MMSFNRSSLMMLNSSKSLLASPDEQQMSKSDLFRSGSFMFRSSVSFLRVHGDDENHSENRTDKQNHESNALMPEETIPAFDIGRSNLESDSVDDFMVEMMLSKSVQQMSISSWGGNQDEDDELEDLPPLGQVLRETAPKASVWKKNLMKSKLESLQDLSLEDMSEHLVTQESPTSVLECVPPTAIFEDKCNHLPSYEEESLEIKLYPTKEDRQNAHIKNEAQGPRHSRYFTRPTVIETDVTHQNEFDLTPPHTKAHSVTPPLPSFPNSSLTLEEQLEAASKRLSRRMQESMESRKSVKQQGGIVPPGVSRPAW